MIREAARSIRAGCAMNKLYTVTRSDLPAGAQLAQSCHALAAFASAHPESFRAWAEPEQRNIVCLAAPTRAALEQLLWTLQRDEARVAEFRETDLDGELTAIACGEEGAKLLSSLPLAGRARPAVAA
jgi:hypothetical protein